MKTLSATLQALVDDGTGLEPVVVLKVEWPSGTKYYTDKDLTLDLSGVSTVAAKGYILNMGSVTAQLRAITTGSLSSVSVELDDTSGDIKSIVNTDLLISTKATLYYMLDGCVFYLDAVTLMAGRIASDMSWDEGQRKITFTVDTALSQHATEVGYAPQVADMANLSADAAGKMWPICFGSVVKVPAIQVYKAVRGTLATYLAAATASVNIDGGENFPQTPTVVQIIVNNLICTGVFTGNTFAITSHNDTFYTAVGIEARATHGADADFNNESVCWLSSTQQIVGQYCKTVKSGDLLINYCYRQEGNKCWFAKPWKKTGATTLYKLDTGDTIQETSYYPRISWVEQYQMETKSSGVWVVTSTVITDGNVQIPGTVVVQFTNLPPTYVVNNAPTTSIKGVYAYRTIDGQKVIQQVPSSYYTKNLSTSLNGQTVTTITLLRELDLYMGEKWETDLFVTLVSSLGSNTSDVINYLLANYSTYTVDATTFAAVKTLIANYPSHFALLEQREIIDLVSDIAFQARLAVIYDGVTAKLLYLSKLPVTPISMGEDEIALKTLTLGSTNKDDIVTKYVAHWQTNYSDKKTDYIYKNNVGTYGENTEEHDFFIYNIYSLVKLSVDFWGNRRSNCWRTAKYKTFLNAIAYEALDTVGLATDQLVHGTVFRSDLIGLGFDTNGMLIDIDTVVACKSGQLIEATDYYTSVPTIGGEALPADPTNGVAEVDYVPSREMPSDRTNNTPAVTNIRFTSLPTRIVRGTAFSISANIVDGSGNVLPISGSFSITMKEITGGDTLSIPTITFTNGVATAVSATLTGGSADDTVVFNITGSGYGAAVSSGIPVASFGTPSIVITPSVVNRGDTFAVAVTGGAPSTLYGVNITASDGSEVLSDGSPVTSLTTDGSGNFSSSAWKLISGTLNLDSVVVHLTLSAQTYDSNTVLVLGENTAISKTVTQTSHGFAVKDVLKYASSTYAKAKADTAANAQVVGIVTKVIDANTFILTMAGYSSLFTGLTANTRYYLDASTAGALTATAPAISVSILDAVSTTAGIVNIGSVGSSSVSAVTKNYNVVAHGFAVGDVLRGTYVSGFAKAQADTIAHAAATGIVTTVIDADNFTLTIIGSAPTVTGLSSGRYYLSDVTAGALVTYAPPIAVPILDCGSSGNALVLIGALNPTAIDFIASNVSMASAVNGTTSITVTGKRFLLVTLIGGGGDFGADATATTIGYVAASSGASPTTFVSFMAGGGCGGGAGTLYLLFDVSGLTSVTISIGLAQADSTITVDGVTFTAKKGGNGTAGTQANCIPGDGGVGGNHDLTAGGAIGNRLKWGFGVVGQNGSCGKTVQTAFGGVSHGVGGRAAGDDTAGKGAVSGTAAGPGKIFYLLV